MTMKTNAKNYPISFMQYLLTSKKLDMNPSYQRQSDAWNKSKKQLLIDTILSKYDMPKFYLRDVKNDPNTPFEYELVDGKQRMSAILEFLNVNGEPNGGFPLHKDTTDSTYSKKKWADLPTAVQQIGLTPVVWT